MFPQYNTNLEIEIFKAERCDRPCKYNTYKDNLKQTDKQKTIKK